MKPIPPWLWRALAAGVVLTALALALAPSFHEAARLGPTMAHCLPKWIVAAIACQVLVYVGAAGILSVALTTWGYKLPLGFLGYTAFAFLFANRALPGPAVAGLAVLVYLLGKRKVAPEAAQTAAATFYLADYISFLTLGCAAALPLIHANSLSLTQGKSLFLAIAVVLICAVIVGIILRSPDAIRSFAKNIVFTFGRMARHSDPMRIAESIGCAVDSFYAHWKQMTARPLPLMLACLWGLWMHAAEVGTLLCCARAFGGNLPPAAAAAGYVGGNLAAIVSFLPGGIGFYEAAMVAIFHGAGSLELSKALAATLLYRILSLLAPLPVVIHKITSRL